MSASKIAAYLGVPRTNVLRALASLKKKNIVYSVGNAYLTNIDSLAKRVAPQLMRSSSKRFPTRMRSLLSLLAAAVELINRMQQVAAALAQAGLVKGQSSGQAGRGCQIEQNLRSALWRRRSLREYESRPHFAGPTGGQAAWRFIPATQLRKVLHHCAGSAFRYAVSSHLEC
jgi:predicted ArsR family transcriptional regulator